MLLKLDFAKAFDTIEHDIILKILQYKGFDDRWIGWVKMLLSSGSSSVLLNGIPGNHFHCKRGVRQGDPLSPLLFVLAADLLQSVVNRMCADGHLTLPIPNNPDFPIVQYADDTLLVMPACVTQLLALKDMLGTFVASTGLHVNYSKSQLIPLNVPESSVSGLAAALGRSVGACPSLT